MFHSPSVKKEDDHPTVGTDLAEKIGIRERKKKTSLAAKRCTRTGQFAKPAGDGGKIPDRGTFSLGSWKKKKYEVKGGGWGVGGGGGSRMGIWGAKCLGLKAQRHGGNASLKGHREGFLDAEKDRGKSR